MAQCPSCQFENMPQYKTCVRCGSILPGSDSPIRFEPPRAGRIEKSLRLASVIRIMNRCAGAVGDTSSRAWRAAVPFLKLEIRPADLQILTAFWKGLLPGLPQWYTGRKPHDQIFFFGWLVLLFLTVLTYGLTLSQLLLGLAIAWHFSSIIDYVVIVARGYSDRLFCFALMVIGSICLFYLPASAVLPWHHFGVQTIAVDAGPLRRGDSLLCSMVRNTTIQPHAGDVVLYHVPQVQYTVQGGGGEGIMNQLNGNLFDRVLAVEGQTVAWEKGKLTIDGEPSLYQPFRAIAQPPDAAFVVPAGWCYIVPSVGFQQLRMPTDAAVWQQMGLVPNGSIYATVWGVRRSLFRFVDINAVE